MGGVERVVATAAGRFVSFFRSALEFRATMDDESAEASAFELAAPRASYSLNQHAITLSHVVRIIAPNGRPVIDPKPEDQATLIHEYIHYLHNYSTLAGLTHMVLHHELAVHLSTTLDPVTTTHFASRGKDLADQGFATTLTRFFETDGAHELPLEGATYRFVPGGESYTQHGKVGELRVQVRSPDNTWRASAVRVGFRAIEESIAFELQSIASRNAGGAEPRSPKFPYLTLRKLRDAYCPLARVRTVVRLAVLSLNVPRMCEFLVDSLRELGRRVNHRKFVRRKAEEATRLLAAAPYRQTAQILPVIYRERGLLEDVARQMQSLIVDLVALRLRRPFFDVEAIEDASGREFERLTASYLPCEVIQNFGDGTAALFTFGQNTDAMVAARRAMQSHIHMANTHLSSHGLSPTIDVESSHQDRSCPFYALCDLQLRKTTPEICRDRPWVRGVRQGGLKTCWYGHGAAMTFATGPRPK